MFSKLYSALISMGDYYRAAKTAHVLEEPERSTKLKEIFELSKKIGCLHAAEEAGACLGIQLSETDFEQIFAGAIENRECKSAFIMAHRLNRKIAPDDAEKIVFRAICDKNFEDAQKLLSYLDCKKAGLYADIISSNKCAACTVHP